MSEYKNATLLSTATPLVVAGIVRMVSESHAHPLTFSRHDPQFLFTNGRETMRVQPYTPGDFSARYCPPGSPHEDVLQGYQKLLGAFQSTLSMRNIHPHGIEARVRASLESNKNPYLVARKTKSSLILQGWAPNTKFQELFPLDTAWQRLLERNLEIVTGRPYEEVIREGIEELFP